MPLLAFLALAVTFSETKTLAVQICLDRKGYSCNAIDGAWGRKSQAALARYCGDRGIAIPATPEAAYDALFAGEGNLFRIETVTSNDLASIRPLPREPAARAALPAMDYESLPEMLAERGHLTRRAFERLNPGIRWNCAAPGLRVILPDFPTIDAHLEAGERKQRGRGRFPEAAVVRISLSRLEILAQDAAGRTLGLYPCSIAKNREKVPARGELRVTSYIAWPNYTYTPEGGGRKSSRFVWPAGPNCPVGVAWLGLNLPGYGIHGTPTPESVGRAESHGCFRLANWNAARLYSICRPGTRILVEP